MLVVEFGPWFVWVEVLFLEIVWEFFGHDFLDFLLRLFMFYLPFRILYLFVLPIHALLDTMGDVIRVAIHPPYNPRNPAQDDDHNLKRWFSKSSFLQLLLTPCSPSGTP